MAKVKKGFLTAILLLVTAIFCVPFSACNDTADGGQEKSAVDEEVTTLGLYTDLQFSLRGENGEVFASVKNKFTLFPSTVTVHAELYRSDTYEDDIANMTLASSSYIYDLDQGETIVASASTDGKPSYWKARAYYKVDNKSWRESLSGTVFFDGSGVKTEPTPIEKDYYISDFLQVDAESVGINFYPERIPHYDPDERYNISMTMPEDFFYLQNGREINTIRSAFGEVKLDPFDFENQLFNFSFFRRGAYFHITLSDGGTAIIGLDGRKEDASGVNLYIRYSKDGESDKGFTATVSEETKQAVHDAVNGIYKIQHNINAYATEWIDFADLLQGEVKSGKADLLLRRPYGEGGEIVPEKRIKFGINGLDIASINNIFGEVKVAPYDMNREPPFSISMETYFNTSIKYPYYSSSVKFADGRSVDAYISYMYTTNISVNLFIIYDDCGTKRYYSGLLDVETQEALVEWCKQTYDEKMTDYVNKLLESMK